MDKDGNDDDLQETGRSDNGSGQGHEGIDKVAHGTDRSGLCQKEDQKGPKDTNARIQRSKEDSNTGM